MMTDGKYAYPVYDFVEKKRRARDRTVRVTDPPHPHGGCPAIGTIARKDGTMPDGAAEQSSTHLGALRVAGPALEVRPDEGGFRGDLSAFLRMSALRMTSAKRGVGPHSLDYPETIARIRDQTTAIMQGEMADELVQHVEETEAALVIACTFLDEVLDPFLLHLRTIVAERGTLAAVGLLMDALNLETQIGLLRSGALTQHLVANYRSQREVPVAVLRQALIEAGAIEALTP
jgi:hypothetical protein